MDLYDEDLRLVTTETKEIGWVQPHAQPGDKIWLLQGCTTPVVLRRVPGSGGGTGEGQAAWKYTVVGYAYFSNYMDGQKWLEHRSKRQNGGAGKRDRLQIV